MSPQLSADRIDEASEPLTMLVKNASRREYVDVYNSHVYRFAGGETLVIPEQMGPPLNEWGLPDHSKISTAKDKDGHSLSGPEYLEVKKGGDLKSIWKFLSEKDGCPLVRLRSDGKDIEREKFAIERHSVARLKKARYEVEQWRSRCQKDNAAGIPIMAKPSYVWDAEADIMELSKNVADKRYQVVLDGAEFDTREECKVYILHPIRWPQYAAGDTWQNYVRDRRGGALDQAPPKAKVVPFKAAEDPDEGIEEDVPVPQEEDDLPPSAPEESTESPLDPNSPLSPAAQNIVRMAMAAGKLLETDTIAHLDDADGKAVVEAMTLIAAKQTTAEKKRAAKYAQEQQG